MNLPQSLQDTINALSNLPGIGTRSAERLAFSLLRNQSGLAQTLGENLTVLQDNVTECPICCNYADNQNINNSGQPKLDPGADHSQLPTPSNCAICQQTNRQENVLCVVESPMDVLALEKTHEYKGVYHVLHGIISPLKKIDVGQIRIEEFFARDLNQFTEIIFALPGTTEAEATALYLIDKLEQHFSKQTEKPNVTRLARGIPSGSDLDYLDIGTLSRAMLDRRVF